MRIREIFFHNFRSFRGERRISFVDPLTDMVRPVSVLAGSNGSGKTTILDAVEALIELETDFVTEAKKTGLVCLALELSSADLAAADEQQSAQSNQPAQVLYIAAGQYELLPQNFNEIWPTFFGSFVRQGKEYRPSTTGEELYHTLRRAVANMNWGKADLHGGLLYFPHNRQLQATQGGPIQQPPEEPQWSFRFSPDDRWNNSLEQLWVWQNYLDLEQKIKEPSHSHLAPFVSLLEDILGKNRSITINQGRATVPVSWSKNGETTRVLLDQLPSGEQQVLLLFGELVRRRRKGVVIAIDEIENSLHPTLQRLVMWNLRKLAREWDAQVIVTTHSLEVINTVRGGAFINLDYPGDRFNLPLPNDEDEAQVA